MSFPAEAVAKKKAPQILQGQTSMAPKSVVFAASKSAKFMAQAQHQPIKSRGKLQFCL